jgi:hypothetical protein
MHVRHQLLQHDFARRTQFARWFIDRCKRDENFLRTIVIGDEATFQMNGKVNTQNVREYAMIGQAPEFNFYVNMSRQVGPLWKWPGHWTIFLRKECQWHTLFANVE